MSKLVCESLEELQEGKFGRALAGAALGGALAFGSPQVGQAQEPTPTEQTTPINKWIQKYFEREIGGIPDYFGEKLMGNIYMGELKKDAQDKLENNYKKYTMSLGGYDLNHIKLSGLMTGEGQQFVTGAWYRNAEKDMGRLMEPQTASDTQEASNKIADDLKSKGYKIRMLEGDLKYDKEYLKNRRITDEKKNHVGFIAEKGDDVLIFVILLFFKYSLSYFKSPSNILIL
jgi:hypothetical protein